MSDEAPLAALEDWVSGVAARLKPGERIRMARRIGMILRRANAKRIAANVEPDGAAMESRKPRPKSRAKQRGRRKGQMFPKMGKLRSMRIRASTEGVQLDFTPRLSRVASVHHFGLEDQVDRRDAASPRTRYPQRRLLGFAPQDRDAIMDEVLNWLDR